MSRDSGRQFLIYESNVRRVTLRRGRTAMKGSQRERGRTMKNIFFLIAIAVILSACANGKPRKKAFNSTLCGEVAGYTISYIAYGEGKMVMIPLSKVRAGNVFIVKLRPMDEFEDADVTVTGTSANATTWMPGKTDRYDNLPRKDFYPSGAFEVGCVPADPLGTIYKFAVKVEKGDVTNILDPRATIVN